MGGNEWGLLRSCAICNAGEYSRMMNEAKRREFRAALALSGKSAKQAATEDLLISPSWLSRVLAGKVVSRPVLAKVDRFIAAQRAAQ